MDFDSEFAQFWATYPRKRNKLEARKAFWSARRSGVELATMLAALDWQRYQSQWVRDGGQYIPHPATWLRAGSYDDEPDEPIAVAPKEYWADECQRVHGGVCEKQWAHDMRMRESA